MSKKPASHQVIAQRRAYLTPSLADHRVKIVVPADIQHEINRISPELQGLQITDENGNVLSTINGLLTPQQLQLLARNERSNVSGTIEYRLYKDSISPDLIHHLKRLVKQCVVAGVTEATGWGGFKCPHVPTEKRKVIVLDLAGLQFQNSSYNSGSMVLVQKEPDPRTNRSAELYQLIMGEYKASFKELEKGSKSSYDKKRYVKTSVAEYFDRYAYRQMVARDFLTAASAMQIARAAGNIDKKVVLRFARYGCGFFACDDTKSERSPERYRFQRLLNLEIFEGVYLALRQYFAQHPNPTEDQNIAAIEFPFYTRWLGRTREEKKQVKLMVALIEDLGCKHRVPVRFTSEDLMKPDHDGHIVAVTNSGDNHAGTGNEMGSTSLDAAVGTNLADEAASFNPTSNAAIGHEFVEIPKFGYHNQTPLQAILDGLDAYEKAEDKPSRHQECKDAAVALKAFIKDGKADEFFQTIANGRTKDRLHKGTLAKLVCKYILLTRPGVEVLATPVGRADLVKKWLQEKQRIANAQQVTLARGKANKKILKLITQQANPVTVMSTLDRYLEEQMQDEKITADSLKPIVAVLEFIERENLQSGKGLNDDVRAANRTALISALGVESIWGDQDLNRDRLNAFNQFTSNIQQTSAWHRLNQPELLKIIFPYIRTQVPFTEQFGTDLDSLPSHVMTNTLFTWLQAIIATDLKDHMHDQALQGHQKSVFTDENRDASTAEREQIHKRTGDFKKAIDQNVRLLEKSEERGENEATVKAKQAQDKRNDRKTLPAETSRMKTIRAKLKEKRQAAAAKAKEANKESLIKGIEAYIKSIEDHEKKQYKGINSRKDMRPITQARLTIADAIKDDLSEIKYLDPTVLTKGKNLPLLMNSKDLLTLFEGFLAFKPENTWSHHLQQSATQINKMARGIFVRNKPEHTAASKISNFLRKRKATKKALGTARSGRARELMGKLSFYLHLQQKKANRAKEEKKLFPNEGLQSHNEFLTKKSRVDLANALLKYLESDRKNLSGLLTLGREFDFDGALADPRLKATADACMRLVSGEVGNEEAPKIAEFIEALPVMNKTPVARHLLEYAETLTSKRRASVLAQSNQPIANTARAMAEFILTADKKEFVGAMNGNQGWNILQIDNKLYNFASQHLGLAKKSDDLMETIEAIQQWKAELSGGAANDASAAPKAK